MNETALQRLHAEQDQSPWVDFVERGLITTAALIGSSRPAYVGSRRMGG